MDSNDLLTLIRNSRTNTSLCIQGIVDLVEETTKGSVRFVDPTNPVVLAFETAINAATVGIEHSQSILQKLNPSIASNQEEIYRHMSDIDYIGRFSNPSSVSFMLALPVVELIEKSVLVSSNGTKQIIIPANTEFEIRGVVFSMQYPIIIRVLPHGGIRAVYDVSKVSPLQTLASNLVTSMITRFDSDIEYLVMNIPLTQFKVTQEFMTITASGGHVQRITFADEFYYCRAFIKPNGLEQEEWQEIKTTHSDQTVDPRIPTLLLQVFEGYLIARIPPVYINTGIIRNSLRVDVYTTKGPLDMDMSGIDGERDIKVRWIDLEKNLTTAKYIAPLNQISSIRTYSTETTSGGTLGISLEELRTRVINNAFASPNLPITKLQLVTDLENRGYSVVDAIDVVTQRTYLATRTLPFTADLGTSSGAGCVMSLFYTTMEALESIPTIITNGLRSTILPTTLFKRVNGKVEIVSQSELTQLNTSTIDAKLAAINTIEYLYTPFHYVFDTTNNAFEVRPYYLDGPVVESRQFINENASTLLTVSTRDYTLERIPQGYRFVVSTRSSDSFKALSDDQITVQLSFTANGERFRATINGSLLGTDPQTNERFYEFVIATEFDINKEDELFLTSFKMFDANNLRILATDLFEEFDLTYIVTDYVVSGMTNSAIDSTVAVYLLDFQTPDQQYVGVTQERFGFRFGSNMKGFWSKSRSIVGTEDYLRHLVDGPAFYDSTVFDRDQFGYIIYEEVTPGNFQPIVLHNAGDPKLDVNGDQEYLYRVGDLVYVDGEKVPVAPRKILREATLFLVDGLYYFTTSQEGLTYKSLIPRSIVSWLNQDVQYYQAKMLEITDIFLYPKTTIGPIEVTINGDTIVNIDSDQRLQVSLYVTQDTYRNGALRNSIENEVKDIINSNFSKEIVSQMDILSDIKDRLPQQVLGVKMEGLGGRNDITTIGVLSSSNSLTIGKKLIQTDDGFLNVVDDITIIFSILAV